MATLEQNKTRFFFSKTVAEKNGDVIYINLNIIKIISDPLPQLQTMLLFLLSFLSVTATDTIRFQPEFYLSNVRAASIENGEVIVADDGGTILLHTIATNRTSQHSIDHIYPGFKGILFDVRYEADSIQFTATFPHQVFAPISYLKQAKPVDEDQIFQTKFPSIDLVKLNNTFWGYRIMKDDPELLKYSADGRIEKAVPLSHPYNSIINRIELRPITGTGQHILYQRFNNPGVVVYDQELSEVTTVDMNSFDQKLLDFDLPSRQTSPTQSIQYFSQMLRGGYTRSIDIVNSDEWVYLAYKTNNLFQIAKYRWDDSATSLTLVGTYEITSWVLNLDDDGIFILPQNQKEEDPFTLIFISWEEAGLDQ